MYGGAPYGKVTWGDILHDTEAISVVETATGADSISALSRQYSDVGTGSETAVINITVLDVGVGLEPQDFIQQRILDLGLGTETGSLIITAPIDVGLGIEVLAVFVPTEVVLILSAPTP